ncbi:MAG: glycosyltransferase family 2 protein [Rhodospirillales bacterium]
MTDPAPRGAVSAVMVSYHTGAVLAQSVAAVLAQPEVAELIVVDNGNPLDVVAWLQRLAREDSRVTLVTGHGNVGFAAACNLAATRARGRFLLLVNPDCIVPPGALGALLAETARLHGPWLAGCRLVNPDGSDQRGSRRALLTPLSALSETLRLDRLFPRNPRFRRLNLHEGPTPAETTQVPAISGAFMLLPTADYLALGGMDDGYFLHVEDLDFCWRFTAAGGRIWFVPAATVTHHQGSSRAAAVGIEWHKARGFVRYFRKNFRAAQPPALLALLVVLIYVRFALKAALIALRSLTGGGRRRQPAAAAG